MPQLLIVRHGIAEDRKAALRKGMPDDERPLTKKGKRRMAKIASAIAQQVSNPTQILSSPLLRAKQTALQLAKVYPGQAVVMEERLAPGTAPEQLTTHLHAILSGGTVVLVGHEPGLSRLISVLISQRICSHIAVKKGGAALIDFPQQIDAGKGTLIWLQTPKQLLTSVSNTSVTRAGIPAATPISDALNVLIQENRRTIDRACMRLVEGGDAESLHDLRVATRRLNSLFTGFSPCFSQPQSLPRAIHQLFKDTNHARDLEVSLSLLSNQHLQLPVLQQLWEDELEDEYLRLREHLPPHWQTLSRQLKTSQTLLNTSHPTTTLGEFAASRLAAEERKLFKQIKRVGRKWDDQRVHKLRIRGKRIRYLIEPIAGERSPAEAVVEQLKQLQDMLGHYHDLIVLQHHLGQLHQQSPDINDTGVKKALQKLKREQKKQRGVIRKKVLGKASCKLRKRLTALSEELAQTTA